LRRLEVEPVVVVAVVLHVALLGVLCFVYFASEFELFDPCADPFLAAHGVFVHLRDFDVEHGANLGLHCEREFGLA